MSSQRVFLTVFVCLGVGSFGCEKAADEAATGLIESAIESAIESESGGEADARISEDGMTIRTAEGEMTISAAGGAKVPTGFPKDVLVYDGASIVTSAKQGDTFILNLTTEDDAKKVVEAYKSKMSSSGWEEGKSMALGPQTMASYRKGGNSSTVTVVPGDDATAINLIVEVGGE